MLLELLGIERLVFSLNVRIYQAKIPRLFEIDKKKLTQVRLEIADIIVDRNRCMWSQDVSLKMHLNNRVVFTIEGIA